MSDLIELLRDAFTGGRPPTSPIERPPATHTVHYAVWRFLHAWQHNTALGPDHAVLLRQIARWSPGLRLGGLPRALESYRERVGILPTTLGELTAAPFFPRWLAPDPIPEHEGIDPAPTVRRPVENTPAEPAIAPLGFRLWQSAAQKEAAWAALEAPPRSTTLLALPTGAGKSLCFQLLPRFGSGLTVVVVPTVALALDQWRSAREVFRGVPDVNPCYYAADASASATLMALRERTTRLLFAAPEGCTSGHLRGVLERAIAEDWLENLVFDEAHLIETWGIYFRVDFQMLSVLRRRWLERKDCRLRTFLLSATFTPTCRDVLRGLYWNDGEAWREFVSQRLRPEITYFTAFFDAPRARDAAVIECAWHLPRPAIVYTTERRAAQELFAALRNEGFRRVACFHGDTRAPERRAILEEWRADQIDLVVATSAFGLGVDKPDVRAVVHACRPEDLHRYYQEVGRGGRDGCSTLSLLLPARGDDDVARGLAPKLMRPETVQRRWEALWKVSRPLDENQHLYELAMNAKADDLIGARTFDEHVRWNKRLVLQLLRAGHLTLEDLSYRSHNEGEEPVEWVTVRLRFSPWVGDVAELMRGPRETELRTTREGFEQMATYLGGARCVGRILCTAYGRDTAYICGGCPACRRGSRPVRDCPPLPVPTRVDHVPEIIVVTQAPDATRATDQNDWIGMFRALVRAGVRRFVCESRHRENLFAVCRDADPDARLRYRIDVTDEVPAFLVAPSDTVVSFHFEHVSESALALRSGRKVIHILARGLRGSLDGDERYPLEAVGASLVDYRSWNLVH